MTRQSYKSVLQSIGLGHCKLSIFDHHTCHAANCSGKKDGLIITMDGAQPQV